MNKNYWLEKTELDNNWDEFIKNSWNGTLFSYSCYLKCINLKMGLYYCFNNQELRAALVVLETENQQSTILHGLVPHNGILFKNPTNKQNIAQQNSERFRITEFIAEILPTMYENIELRLDPLFQDIRPFLWVNYGTNNPKYLGMNRYTSYLSIKGLSDSINPCNHELFKNMSTSRRQEIRYAKKKGVLTREDFNLELFIDFYRMTMNRQNIDLEEQVVKEIRQIVEKLFLANLGRMFISYSDGRPGSVVFIGIDHKRGYFLFGANDPTLRNEHTGSAVLWDAFKLLNEMGIEEIDLEGINSPQRGWFKLSFGGTISPYYHLSYKTT
jgi:hypothetical protein